MLNDYINLFFGDLDRLSAADKSRDPHRVLDQIPGLIIELHFDKYVARIEFLVGLLLLFTAQLYDLFSRYEYPEYLIFEPFQARFLFDSELDLFFKSRICMNYVPVFTHHPTLR